MIRTWPASGDERRYFLVYVSFGLCGVGVSVYAILLLIVAGGVPMLRVAMAAPLAFAVLSLMLWCASLNC